jgi:hypothetical protein
VHNSYIRQRPRGQEACANLRRSPALLRELGQIAQRIADDPLVSDDERELARAVLDALQARQPIQIAMLLQHYSSLTVGATAEVRHECGRPPP